MSLGLQLLELLLIFLFFQAEVFELILEPFSLGFHLIQLLIYSLVGPVYLDGSLDLLVALLYFSLKLGYVSFQLLDVLLVSLLIFGSLIFKMLDEVLRIWLLILEGVELASKLGIL